MSQRCSAFVLAYGVITASAQQGPMMQQQPQQQEHVLHFEQKCLRTNRTNMEFVPNDDRCTLSENRTRML
jgi:hypothetical protein